MDGNPYARMMGVIRGESGEQSQTGETDRAGLGAGPAKLRIGTVTQRVPLAVSVAGVVQPASALRINERLVKGAKWKAKFHGPVDTLDEAAGDTAMTQNNVHGPVSGSVACSGIGCNPVLTSITGGTMYSDGLESTNMELEQVEIDLEVNDQVLMLTEDDQVFYIICKVVNAV